MVLELVATETIIANGNWNNTSGNACKYVLNKQRNV